MQYFLIAILALSSVFEVHGWVGISLRNEEKLKGLPNQCYYEGVGYMTAGEQKRLPNACVKLTCEIGGNVGITGCGIVQVEPPCKVLKGDLSKPHPDCCFEIYCPPTESKSESN